MKSPPPVPDETDPELVDLRAKVRFLSDPSSYPTAPVSVQSIETHMSWVFLAGEQAYKLKKPVRYARLDYRRLEDRERNCTEEVRLNRRLARRVYLGVVSLGWTPGTGFSLGESEPSLGAGGRVVDWLVHMRRLPAELLLDRAIAAGPVSHERIEGAALLLTRFYQEADRFPMSPLTYRERFRSEIDGTREELLLPSFELPEGPIRRLARSLTEFLESGDASALDARTEERRIVEGHGDLRPEHVFLGADPAVIDCLEFDVDLRLLDPVDELGFLALECALLGQPEVGTRFLEIYRESSGDRCPLQLLRFYQGFRAFVRAKIAIWHLKDDEVSDPDRWRMRAVRYLELGQACINSTRDPPV